MSTGEWRRRQRIQFLGIKALRQNAVRSKRKIQFAVLCFLVAQALYYFANNNDNLVDTNNDRSFFARAFVPANLYLLAGEYNGRTFSVL